MALVMYDLDGTLLDTADEIAQAVNLTLNEFGLKSVSVDQVRNWIGHGTGWLMKRAWEEQKDSADSAIDSLSDADWDKVMQRFVHHYESTAGTTSTPFPFVLETLRKARDYGVKQAVVTNKERRFADRILEKHGLTDQFDMVICGDSLSVKKPNPAVITHCLNTLGATQGESLFIGDSEIDISTAKAAGVLCWAVPYGYNLGRPIADAMPDRIVPDIREVPNFFRHL
jgi:phosphoglycolate phosphatase